LPGDFSHPGGFSIALVDYPYKYAPVFFFAAFRDGVFLLPGFFFPEGPSPFTRCSTSRFDTVKFFFPLHGLE